MKMYCILFLMLFTQTISFGQAPLPFQDKNVVISYGQVRKIGTRYEEKCKATLDVYEVIGTVQNNNADKAVSLLGTSLTFMGNVCGWYEGKYRIEDHGFNINFFNKQLWFGQSVDILPMKSLSVKGEVWLAQNKPFPLPGYNLRFDLVDPQQKPAEPQAQAGKKMLEWSAWQSFGMDGCNPNIEYRYLTERGNALNYQVHLWFEVRNNNNKAVSYLFNLLDAKDKVHFGEQHSNKAGETIRFVHKMSGDIIKKWKLLNLVYSNTGKPVCDGKQNNNENVAQGNQQSNPQNNNVDNQIPKATPETINAAMAKMKSVIEEISSYLMENTPGVPATILKDGTKIVVTKYFNSTVKFKLSGCDGTIKNIVITGENATYNENARKTLQLLEGKYVVAVNRYCFTQPATIQLTN